MQSPFADQEQAAGAVFTEQFGIELPEHFGDPGREYQAARQAVGLLDMSFRGLLEVTGTDRIRWLNGQITNDVKDLKPGEGRLAAILNVKGHLLADVAVYGLGDSIWIDLPRVRTETVWRHLDRYIVADDVVVTNVSDRIARLMLAGPQAPALMQAVAGPDIASLAPWHHREARVGSAGVRGAASRVLAMPGYALMIPVEAQGTVWEAVTRAGRDHGLRPVGFTALNWLRVEAGWPWYGVDFDEGNLLMEALTPDHVSFSKGCYIGQEVVIRIEHQGHVNKKLCGLLVSGEVVPSRGADIVSGERKVGTVTSAIGSPALNRVIALGYVRRETWDPGTKLRIALGDGMEEAEVSPLPFIKSAG